MSTTEAALTVSLFAAMAALQFGGSHAAMHGRQGPGGLPELAAPPVFPTGNWAVSTQNVIEGLAAAGALGDPDTEGMIAMGAAVGGPGN